MCVCVMGCKHMYVQMHAYVQIQRRMFGVHQFLPYIFETGSLTRLRARLAFRKSQRSSCPQLQSTERGGACLCSQQSTPAGCCTVSFWARNKGDGLTQDRKNCKEGKSQSSSFLGGWHSWVTVIQRFWTEWHPLADGEEDLASLRYSSEQGLRD